MELVIETLKEKIIYLEKTIEKYNDTPEIVDHFKKTIIDFNQVIGIVELCINLKKNK
jgi:hypothetical protein